MKYKALIIGTGKIALSHAQACLNNKNIDLTAACDKNIRRLNRFCKTWKIKDKYKSVVELLNSKKTDIVVLATPSATHFSLIEKILAHKDQPRILLVEKPVCLKRSQLIRIRKILLKTSTKLIVNHSYRFHSGLKKVTNIIRSGSLGRVLSARAVYYGGLLNNGVHLIDTLRMLTGLEFRVVRAGPGAAGSLPDVCVDAELRAQGSSGPKAYLESFDQDNYQLYEMELRLSKGRIRIMDFGEDIFIDKALINKNGEKELKAFKKISSDKKGSPSVNIFKSIIAYLKKGDKAVLREAGIKEATKTMEVLWKIKQKA